MPAVPPSALAASRRAFLLAALAAPLSVRAQRDELLPRIDDLRPLLAAVGRDKRPLLLFFSTPGCPYCLEVRRSYLRPRVQEGPAASGVTIREIEIVSARRVVDEDGRSITESDLAARFGVKMVPYLQLVDARLRPLADPLIGLDRSGFYDGYLQSAIDSATKKLAAS